jgi:dTDP-glucose 4,6-dehydratase
VAVNWDRAPEPRADGYFAAVGGRSWRAQGIRDLTGSTSPLHFLDAAPDDPTRRCPDIRLANQTLGWAPRVDLDEGLRRTIAWFAPRVHLDPSGDPEPADSRSLAH